MEEQDNMLDNLHLNTWPSPSEFKGNVIQNLSVKQPKISENNFLMSYYISECLQVTDSCLHRLLALVLC